MIEADHTLVIDTGISSVWDYVADIRRWALLFPGCKECQVIDDHHSKWVIKVGAGGMVKTVNVLVHVLNWDGPDKVDFNYTLDVEPVTGSGSYSAQKQGENATEITLRLEVAGSGQMAPMWEAMCKPLLPQMAKSFAGKLKAEIEASAGIAPVPRPPLLARLRARIADWWRRIIDIINANM